MVCMVKKGTEFEVVQVRIPKDIHAALTDLLEESSHLYLSAYCRGVIIEHVKKHTKKGK
jgi:hypothetical protein